MNAPLEIALDSSRFPERVRQELREGLRAGRLPAAFLYASPAQAGRWLAYHRAWSPARRDAEVQALYGRAFARAAQALPAGPARLVGLGCGGGQKDAEAAQALAERPGAAALAYAPVDASAPLVAEAALAVRGRVAGIALHPLVADLAAAPRLRPWLEGIAGERGAALFTCFGMLPNLDAEPFTRWVAGLLAPRDRLLISAHLSPRGYAADHERILAQYDNGSARAWYAGALGEIGLADAPLTVRSEPLAADGSVWRIVVEAAVPPGLELSLLGEPLPLPPGGRLRVFFSTRFTEAAARRLLEGAGLAAEESWLDATGEEGIFLCRRSA